MELEHFFLTEGQADAHVGESLFVYKRCLQIKMNNSLRMKMNSSSRDDEPEMAVVETLRGHFPTYEVFKRADLIREQAKDIFHLIKDGNAVLNFLRSARLCGHGGPTLESYDWKKN